MSNRVNIFSALSQRPADNPILTRYTSVEAISNDPGHRVRWNAYNKAWPIYTYQSPWRQVRITDHGPGHTGKWVAFGHWNSVHWPSYLEAGRFFHEFHNSGVDAKRLASELSRHGVKPQLVLVKTNGSNLIFLEKIMDANGMDKIKHQLRFVLMCSIPLVKQILREVSKPQMTL